MVHQPFYKQAAPHSYCNTRRSIALFLNFYMHVHVAFILWFKLLLKLKEKFLEIDVFNSSRPLENVFALLSDFDECALVDNNCTKGGANCTNTVGSFSYSTRFCSSVYFSICLKFFINIKT